MLEIFAIIVMSLIVLGSLSKESYWFAFWVTVGSIVGAWFLFDIGDSIKQITVREAVVYAIMYLVVGSGYSVAKWALQLNKFTRRMKEEANIKGVSVQVYAKSIARREFYFPSFEGVNLTTNKDGDVEFIKASDFRETVAAWIMWWPFLLILTIFDDLFRNVANFVLDLTGRVYQKILDSFTISIK